ncbi:MAG: hypothetical protein QF673_03760 [Candidatus Hydrothermarchaeota archaeon]|nr:hypothetical protein [Candidatus Hydrothermarchaeota archaeon]
MRDIEAVIEDGSRRMQVKLEVAVKAIAERNWDMVILGIVGVSEEFRRIMSLCGKLSDEQRMKFIHSCGLEHHAAKARIAAALKRAFEDKK